MIGIRTTLAENLIRLAIFRNESAVGFLKLDAIDGEGDAAVRVLILERGDDDLRRTLDRAFIGDPAVSFRRRLSSERGTCGIKIDAVEKFDEADDITLGATATTIENLLFDIDGEAIVAATSGTRSNTFGADALELDAAAFNLFFNGYGAPTLYPVLVLVAQHDDT